MPELELRTPRAAFGRNHYLSVLLTLVVSASAAGARVPALPENPPQSTMGTIRGVVTALQQEKQSSLEGIQVELKRGVGDSQPPLKTITDSEGRYEFTKLPQDKYTLRLNQQGFKPFAQSVLLGANETSVLDVALTLDTVVANVEVKEQTTPVSSESSSPASTVNNAQLEILPLAQQKFRDSLPLDLHLHFPFTEHGNRHKVRVGLYSINLTNHGNFHDVYNNETSPFFGKFTGFQRRVHGRHHLWQEPDAGNPLVRIRGGGCEQS